MRKALMGFILTATMMTPIAAEAQRGNRGGDGESRAARIEARNEARQQRQQQSQPQQQQQQQQAPQQPQVARSNNGGDGGNRGGWNRGGGDNNRGDRGGDNNRGDRGDRGNRGDWNRGGDDGNRRTRTQQPSVYPQAWQGNPNDPRLQHYRDLERRNQNSGYDRRGDRDGRNWRNDRNDRDGRNWRNDRNDRDSRRGDRRNWRNDWNRSWRNDNRYNWSFWRGRNRHVFHLSPYYSPYRNWSYQRFSIGLFLDSLFYNQRYWIGDPYQYRLPAAPYGTQWVRYYNDVVLVDVYTGEVLDVIHDFFW